MAAGSAGRPAKEGGLITWFKVDDNLALHPKVLAAGNAAVGLWVRAGAWSAQQLTDGFVPADVVKLLGDMRQAKALVDAGLWVPESGGFRFHQWHERQPRRDQVEADRAAARERMRSLRAARSGEQGANVRANFATGCSQPPSRPVPSSVVVTRSSPSPSVPREVVHKQTVDKDKIREALRSHAPHRKITDEHIEKVTADICARGKPRDPTAYVLAAIKDDPARYLPTSQPPPFRLVRGESA